MHIEGKLNAQACNRICPYDFGRQWHTRLAYRCPGGGDYGHGHRHRNA
jgi:hypothetical protein